MVGTPPIDSMSLPLSFIPPITPPSKANQHTECSNHHIAGEGARMGQITGGGSETCFEISLRGREHQISPTPYELFGGGGTELFG